MTSGFHITSTLQPLKSLSLLLLDELGVVVAESRQQVLGPPPQEAVQSARGTFLHGDLIAVAPDLQPGQRHTDLQRPVELKHIQFSSYPNTQIQT